MPVRSAFFDSQNGDRIYSAADFARVFQRLARDGVVPKEGGELRVTPTTPESMAVSVGTGVAFIQGYFFEVYNQAETLQLSAADPNNPRIDRVVVRLDLLNRQVTLAVKKGTPAVTPAPPSLQRDAWVWELSLAQVYVPKGAAAVYADDITDERPDSSVCGWAKPPAQLPPSVRVAVVYSQSIPNSTTTPIAWDGRRSGFYSRGMWEPDQPDRTKIFIPEDGLYLIIASVRWENNTTGNRMVAIHKNTNTVIAKTQGPPATGSATTSQQVSTVAPFVKGDYIQIMAWQTSGGYLNLQPEPESAPECVVVKIA